MLLGIAKLAVRVESDDFDCEISNLIESCLADLELSGIVKLDENDALIIQAVRTYTKAYFDVTNPDYDKLVNSYQSLKTYLSLTEEYTTVVKQNETKQT